MRKPIIAIIIVAVVGLAFIILAAPDRESAPEFPLEEEEDYIPELAINSVIGHDERSEIGGLFDGKTQDTLRISFAAKTEYIDSTLYVTLDGKRFIRTYQLEGRVLSEYTSHNIHDLKAYFLPDDAESVQLS